MKKNLLTKTLLLSALFSAVVFAGCNNGSQEPSAVEEISVTSVVPATKAENAEPVPSEEVFKKTVMKKNALIPIMVYCYLQILIFSLMKEMVISPFLILEK